MRPHPTSSTPRNSRQGLSTPAFAICALALACSAAWGAPAVGEAATDRILVMPRAGLPEAALAAQLASMGGKGRRVGKSELRIVELHGKRTAADVVAELRVNPHIKFAELDVRVAAHQLVTNDPYLGSEWQMPVVRSLDAWSLSQGSGVTIAILDSGVLASHEDLATNIVGGYNAYDGSSVTSDVLGHGTLVAGTAAAASNNAKGVAGMAGAARILPIRITDAAGAAYYSTIAAGITYAADNGVRVANCSWGPLYNNSSVQSAGAYLKSKGGLLVVSAGNNGVNENAPAVNSMIVVSATDANDQLASWSSYGSMVSVAAPGVGIWTTNSGGGYSTANGTSFASPTAAGVIALMMAANPKLSNAQVESLLYATATDLGTAGRDIYFGYGRVDAYAAVKAALATAAADTTPPTASIISPVASSPVLGLVAIDAAATDNVGVTRVDLKVNGAVVASDTAAPYSFTWDSTKVANGSATFAVVAYDAAGNSASSASVTIQVANPTVADTTPPSVGISSPADGASVGGTVQIVVKASDNSGAATLKQRLYIDGSLVSSATGASLTYGWNTKKSGMGLHKITATATDAAGNVSTQSVTVTRTR